ncbi:FxsA family protein [Hyphomicrobiales bacterium]|jgi:UPF0716 protein FxsA|nr:FxsA family protein [Hyphomicrobiales bacterium]|tara:strand:+ start:6002 stop:6442 length:441 start_codon:yes stop_codon:yes gene_type:complete
MKLFIFLTLILSIIYFEVELFKTISDSIGFSVTLFLIIITGILGFFLIKKQFIEIITSLNKKNTNNQEKLIEFLEVLFLPISGFLLFLPGFFTDIIGFILLIKIIRKYLLAKIIKAKKRKQDANFIDIDYTIVDEDDEYDKIKKLK